MRFAERDNEAVEYDADGPFFAHPEASCFQIEYPQKLEGLPSLARTLATLSYESKDFAGALLWFTGWGVWNYLEEGIGYRIVEAMHTAAGQPKSFEAGPGPSFPGRRTKRGNWPAPPTHGFWLGRELRSTLVRRAGPVFLHVSHDSFVTVVTRTKEFYDKTFDTLTKLSLGPTEAHKVHLQRFCHTR